MFDEMSSTGKRVQYFHSARIRRSSLKTLLSLSA
jgi:hypothetical protein